KTHWLMKRKINCETARNFSVEKALEKLGHFPQKTSEKEAWFLSPFRSETQASFKVSKTKNRWYDHGEGIGGNVIDLVSMVLKCTISETLEFINGDVSYFPFQQPQIFCSTETEINISKVQNITHPALIQYLSARGITISVANSYCKEVWYTNKYSQYFAIGLQNEKSGWEFRNKIFKNSSSPKSFTYIHNHNKQLIILEGLFDLLSLATLKPRELKVSDIIVLNSIAFIKDVEIHFAKYECIHLYLDNDLAGQKATLYLKKNHKHIIDRSDTYKYHEDLNDFLCYEKRKEI
ncbi:toprim domain-containing protein, partial [Cellulophaga sp. F20128]|uniref:toprim domain-containing protein n=1 Tax=Cellulophaga sp. F20128 TaxID=2926413 RepID=UPI001FF23FC6